MYICESFADFSSVNSDNCSFKFIEGNGDNDWAEVLANDISAVL